MASAFSAKENPEKGEVRNFHFQIFILFLFFETKSHYVYLTVLELTLQTRLALN